MVETDQTPAVRRQLVVFALTTLAVLALFAVLAAVAWLSMADHPLSHYALTGDQIRAIVAHAKTEVA